MRQPRYPTVDKVPTNRELQKAVDAAGSALTAADVGSAAYADVSDFAPAGGIGSDVSACEVAQHASLNVSAASGALTLPAATQAGDVILIIGAGPYGIDTPSGFATVYSDVAANNVVRCVAKVSLGGETSVALTSSGSTPFLVAVCAVLRGTKLKIMSGATATGHTTTQSSPVTVVKPSTFAGIRKILAVIGGRRDSSTPLSPVAPSGGTVLESIDRTGSSSSNPSYSMKLVEYDEADVDAQNAVFLASGPAVNQTFTFNGSAAYTLNIAIGLN